MLGRRSWGVGNEGRKAAKKRRDVVTLRRVMEECFCLFAGCS